MSELELVLVIVVVVLVVGFFMVIYMLFRQREFFNSQILTMQKLIMERASSQESLMSDVSDSVIDRVYSMSRDINQTLTTSQTNSTNSLNSLDMKFNTILSKVSDLESSNSSVGVLKDEVMKLNRVFSNPKSRGSYGEFELEKILRLSYGENSKFYELQKLYPSGVRVDAALMIKDNLFLPIDSKFPLTNYLKINEIGSKAFKGDMKKHINDIANKYITPPNTTEFAVMFIPSEAVFVYVCEHLGDVMEYGYQRAVFISSPSTLMALLYSLSVFLKDEQISKNAKIIKKEIYALSVEFEVFRKQNRQALKFATNLRDAVNLIDRSCESIADKFSSISRLN